MQKMLNTFDTINPLIYWLLFARPKQCGTLACHLLHNWIHGGSRVQILARRVFIYKFEWELTWRSVLQPYLVKRVITQKKFQITTQKQKRKFSPSVIWTMVPWNREPVGYQWATKMSYFDFFLWAYDIIWCILYFSQIVPFLLCFYLKIKICWK